MTLHILPTTVGLVTVTEAGPDLWEIVMNLDGVLWTSFQWGPEDRDTAEQQARRLVEGLP